MTSVDTRARTTSGASSTSSTVARSRTWSTDITKVWSIPQADVETLQQRVDRYTQYLTLTEEQLKHIYGKFQSELQCGLLLHRDEPDTPWSQERCSLKMLDTCVATIPNGNERGVAYALDFGGSNLRAVRVKLDGNGRVALTSTKAGLKELAPELRKGLLDRDATASQLFNAFAESMKDLMSKQGDLQGSEWVGCGFTFSFPIVQKQLKNANLLVWTKEFETGRNTNDPVESMDVSLLLDQAFWRREVPAKTVAVLNDTTGTLLSCAYEKPRSLPPCLIGVILGTGVNGCYFQEDAKSYGYNGVLINTELAGFDKDLPFNDVDLEVDFAFEATRGAHAFEKMVSGGYIGEVTRRLLVKVFQKAAPQLAWVRESLPAEVCANIITDKTEDLQFSRQCLSALWDWTPPVETVKIVQHLATMVFDRSAALAAVAIAGMAKKTGRLSPAMGGMTCGIDGSVYTCNEWYQHRLRHFLNVTLGAATSALIHTVIATDGSGKGAAILAGTITSRSKEN
eukprot:Polyplicarium_translucidae@DN2330_c0_g1_i1.p1